MGCYPLLSSFFADDVDQDQTPQNVRKTYIYTYIQTQRERDRQTDRQTDHESSPLYSRLALFPKFDYESLMPFLQQTKDNNSFYYIRSSEILEFPSVINFDIITSDDIKFHFLP